MAGRKTAGIGAGPTPRRRARVGAWVVAALLLPALAPAARAQRPPDAAGVVLDGATGAPVAGARIRVPALGRAALTDAAGRFRLPALEPGVWALRVEHLAYAARTVSLRVESGATATVEVRLAPVPLAVARLVVAAAASGGVRLDRAALEALGARTAGDALRSVPGVLVRSTGPGAPQHVSIRGGEEHAVLVLVDGVPLNDPVTGVADLSAVPASAISTVTVLHGAQSARYGPRAGAGVVLIETRRAGRGATLALSAGSLGARELTGELGLADGAAAVGGALRFERGTFEFELPPEAGGGERRRENADATSWEAHVAARATMAGGALDARAGVDGLRRGLPGRGYAPSPHARQTMERARASVQWTRAAASLALTAARQCVTSRDAAPPVGLPYAETATADVAEARADVERAIGRVGLGGAVELRAQRLSSTMLRASAPRSTADGGLALRAELPWRVGSVELRVAAAARVDRDGAARRWYWTRSLGVGATLGPASLDLTERSAYTPPTPGDRFFRDAVGIAPNPDLRPERVPGEVELAVRWRGAVGPLAASLRGSAYRGDVRGMILWAPDYRFVWSPYNADARRRGLELAGDVSAPGGHVRAEASWTRAVATYAGLGAGRDVQVVYRPRHLARLAVQGSAAGLRLGLEASYTGRRTTAPTLENQLPGFWTLGADLRHARSIGGWRAELDLRVDRLRDVKDALIFGFPMPGRQASLTLRLAPGRAHSPTIEGVP